MVNTNILTLFHFGILHLTFYSQTYIVYLIRTIDIRREIQPKMHYKIHICTIIAFAMI